MDYLKEYGLTEEQIEDVVYAFKINNEDSDVLVCSPERIERIIKLFTDIGVNNIYEIMTINPGMFGNTVESIKKKIDAYPDKNELARLINENPYNLSKIYLM